MLAEVVPVVAGKTEHRVVGELQLIQQVQQFAYVLIDSRNAAKHAEVGRNRRRIGQSGGLSFHVASVCAVGSVRRTQTKVGSAPCFCSFVGLLVARRRGEGAVTRLVTKNQQER